MKVLHLNYYNFGGAGIAATRLNQALVESGVDSTLLVCRKQGDPAFVNEASSFQKGLAQIRNSLSYRGLKRLGFIQNEIKSVNILPSGIIRVINDMNPDVVHLHWINAEMLSIAQLARIKQPVVWTLHDMWPFCGAEHYTTSTRYISGYQKSGVSGRGAEAGGQKTDRELPDASSLRPEAFFDLDRWTFLRKQKHWKAWHPHVVTPSRWLAECARQSVLFKNLSVEAIPNCLNLKVFKPLDRAEAKNRFGLPLDKKLILFGAYSPMDIRKGGDLLEAALKQGVDKNWELVVFGASKGEQVAGLKTHWLGSFSDEDDLAKLYNATDLFAAPSRQDNLPNTCVEAQACGVPVVAFNIGGLSDIVEHETTGFLARPFDTRHLMEGICQVFAQDRHAAEAMRKKARENAEKKFSMAEVASQYSTIYNEVLGRDDSR